MVYAPPAMSIVIGMMNVINAKAKASPHRTAQPATEAVKVDFQALVAGIAKEQVKALRNAPNAMAPDKWRYNHECK